MTVERVCKNWFSDTAAAFRLSNGRIITVPAQDLDQIARLCFAASIEWRNNNDGVDRSPIEPQPGPSAYFVGT